MSLSRRRLLASAGVALVAPHQAWSAPSRKYPVVIRLPWRPEIESLTGFQAITSGIVPALARLGYVEGRNLEVLTQHAVPDMQAFERQLAVIRSGPVDALLIFSAKGALTWQSRIPDVPIVVWGVVDPVAAGIAREFLRPGGRITGLTQGIPEVASKHVDFLRQLVPRLSGVALFADVPLDGDPDYQREIRMWEGAIRAAGLGLWTLRDSGEKALEALDTLGRRGFGAAIYATNPVPPSPDNVRTHALAAVRHRIAPVGVYDHLVDHDFLLAYGEHPADFYLRAAQHIVHVFRIGSAADVPFMSPSRYELHLNLGTAAALGITVPPGMRLSADRLVG